jgi:hypothetical protein
MYKGQGFQETRKETKKITLKAVFYPKGTCPHSLTHWIRFEKGANTHLKAVSH